MLQCPGGLVSRLEKGGRLLRTLTRVGVNVRDTSEFVWYTFDFFT